MCGRVMARATLHRCHQVRSAPLSICGHLLQRGGEREREQGRSNTGRCVCVWGGGGGGGDRHTEVFKGITALFTIRTPAERVWSSVIVGEGRWPETLQLG